MRQTETKWEWVREVESKWPRMCVCVCVSVYVSGLADASLTLTGCRYWSVSLFQTVCLFSSLGIHEIHSLSFVLSLSLQWREWLANSIASFPSIASVSRRFASHRRTTFNPEISLRRHLRSPAYLINIFFQTSECSEIWILSDDDKGVWESIINFCFSLFNISNPIQSWPPDPG